LKGEKETAGSNDSIFRFIYITQHKDKSYELDRVSDNRCNPLALVT